MHLPGSGQVQHACALLLSRPFLSRIPDQSLIVSEAGEGTHHVQATRDRDGRYALVYLPSGNAVELDLTGLSGEQLVADLVRSAHGRRVRCRHRPEADARATFVPPQGGPDRVLVLDDATYGFPAPGTVIQQ